MPADPPVPPVRPVGELVAELRGLLEGRENDPWHVDPDDPWRILDGAEQKAATTVIDGDAVLVCLLWNAAGALADAVEEACRALDGIGFIHCLPMVNGAACSEKDCFPREKWCSNCVAREKVQQALAALGAAAPVGDKEDRDGD